MKRLPLLSAATGVLMMAASMTASASGDRTYSVTVTNITKATQFTPIAAASHTRAIALFELGQPASSALADVAESGSIAALAAELDASPAVYSIAATEGLLEAGDSVTFEISTNRRTRNLSLAAMILPTNDTFVALDTVRLPHYGTVVYRASAYDAGSEPNDESCAHIPGPSCGGEGRSPEDGNAEGFVHIANGIHGIADVAAEKYDWRGSVAEVSITRIH